MSVEPQPILLREYRPPAWLIPSCDLHISLHDGEGEATLVRSELLVRPNPAAGGTADGEPLRLDGDGLELEELLVDGKPPEELGARLEREGDSLLLHGLRGEARLQVRNRIHPERNTSLMGLYRSGGIFCSQCEPEGFRRIAYFADRPDVLCRFSCRVEAPRAYTHLLSNGDLRERGELPGGRHYAHWSDPHPKPAYLFALVAGNLEVVEGGFTTASGREVLLQLYAHARDIGRLQFALEALRGAMRWDEQHYGREYDLDRFMIVAVDAFNFGAMENKGLNIFNSAALLAAPDITTDEGYARIRGIVAHEYLHNWSGNRVTLRDWFQLCLKEGFTVFRDQCFSESMVGPMRERLRSVDDLRRVQFREDAGALSHPVRPESYARIDNFYTPTVYEKGAELVRMQRTILGQGGFRAAAERYFDECDGTAATVEDLLARTCGDSPVPAQDFLRWYRQPGTPLLRVRHQPIDGGEVRLQLSQQLRDQDAPPLPIPIRVAAFAPGGGRLPLRLAAGRAVPGREGADGELCLLLLEQSMECVLQGVQPGAVLSVLRGFSAPVRLDYPQAEPELELLATWDDDPYVRWDSGQRLMRGAMAAMIAGRGLQPQDVPPAVLRLGERLLGDAGLGGDELSLMLRPPTDVAYDYEPAELDAAAQARKSVLVALGRGCAGQLRRLWDGQRVEGAYQPSLEQGGRRAARTLALELLALAEPAEWIDTALELVRGADNLTERLSGLRALSRAAVEMGGVAEQRWRQALADYEARFGGEPLAMDYWFAVQAGQDTAAATELVPGLLQHPLAADNNPNRIRAILGNYCRNTRAFHAPGGEGYRLVAEQLGRLDAINPMLSAALVTQFGAFRQLDAQRRVQARAALEGLQGLAGLSRELGEQLRRLLD